MMNAVLSDPYVLREQFNCLAVDPDRVKFGSHLTLVHVHSSKNLIATDLRLKVTAANGQLSLESVNSKSLVVSAVLKPTTLSVGNGRVHWWRGSFESTNGSGKKQTGQMYLMVRKLEGAEVRIVRCELFVEGSTHIEPNEGCVRPGEDEGKYPVPRKGPKPPKGQDCPAPQPADIAADQDDEGEAYDDFEN
jgi:hypothetical protein